MVLHAVQVQVGDCMARVIHCRYDLGLVRGGEYTLVLCIGLAGWAGIQAAPEVVRVVVPLVGCSMLVGLLRAGPA